MEVLEGRGPGPPESWEACRHLVNCCAGAPPPGGMVRYFSAEEKPRSEIEAGGKREKTHRVPTTTPGFPEIPGRKRRPGPSFSLRALMATLSSTLPPTGSARLNPPHPARAFTQSQKNCFYFSVFYIFIPIWRDVSANQKCSYSGSALPKSCCLK